MGRSGNRSAEHTTKKGEKMSSPERIEQNHSDLVGWMKASQSTLEKVWKDEPKGLWESYLTKKSPKSMHRKRNEKKIGKNIER